MSIWIQDGSSGRCSRHVNDSLRSDDLVTRPTTVRAASWQPGSRNRNYRALLDNRVLPAFLLFPCPLEDRMMKRQRLTRAAARVDLAATPAHRSRPSGAFSNPTIRDQATASSWLQRQRDSLSPPAHPSRGRLCETNLLFERRGAEARHRSRRHQQREQSLRSLG